jgi:site-specific DNA-methyltransferase (adenine-specific)
MEMFHDHFQNYKRHNIPKAQLIIADIPYNIGINAYASNPSWYKDGDNKNGESNLAGKTFFDTDNDFKIPEFMHFVNTMLKKEPKEKSQAGCMIVFCEFEQQFMLIEKAKEYGLNHYINLVFRKNYSAQVEYLTFRVE